MVKQFDEEVTQEEESSLITVKELAQELRVDETTVRRWAKQGILEVVTLPHRGKRKMLRIKRATLVTLLEGNAS